MTWLDALVIGLFQVLAVFPGSSRSGSTIPGGMLRNFDRPSATRFAFLMAAPIMLAAGGYESLSVLKTHILHTILAPLAVGFVVAAIIGWLSIRWLISFVSKNSLILVCRILRHRCSIVRGIPVHLIMKRGKDYILFLFGLILLSACGAQTSQATPQLVRVYVTICRLFNVDRFI